MSPNSVPSFENSVLRALRRSEFLMNRAAERLASGRRINRGSDDPAGMVAASHMDQAIAQLEAEDYVLSRAASNAQIADGHFSALGEMMSELRGLLVAGGNGAALSDDERAAYQMQVDGLVSTIQRFAGDAAEALQGVGLPDGGGGRAAEALRAAASSLSSLATGGAHSLSSGNIAAAEEVLSAASDAFLSTRGSLGAYQKYDVEARQSFNAARYEHLLDARSRIVDADFAEEVSNLVHARLLNQAGVAMMRVSRQNSEAVLRLLR